MSIKRAIHFFLFWHTECVGEEEHSFKDIFYTLLGYFTLTYVVLQLYVFHAGAPDLPNELVSFWMVSLPCYAMLKEVFRWVKEKSLVNSKYGELFVMLIIFAFFWMCFWNIARSWIFGMEYLPMPEGYLESAIEALVVFMGSNISAVKFKKSLEEVK